MIRHYFKIIRRTALKSKIYTLINIAGLSTGMVVFILIMLYVRYEYSIDTYHENKDRIFRIAKQEIGNMYLGDDRFAVTMAPLGPAVKSEFPEVKYFSRICRSWNSIITADNKTHLEPTVFGVDPDAFKMFTFNYLYGNPVDYLHDKYSAVITESVAEILFMTKDVVGKTINFENKQDLMIVGVINDMPKNSHFRMNIMLPFETLMELTNSTKYLDNWQSSSYYTYIMLNKGSDPDVLESKLPVMWNKYTAEIEGMDDSNTRLFLQKYSKIHLHSDIHFDLGASLDIRQLYIYETIAILILLIACINYMNLSSARATLRAKEVGVRKVSGAYRRDLIFQFLGESILITFSSLVISLITVSFLLPYFQNFTELSVSLDLVQNPGLIALLIILGMIVGVVSGSYPAFLLSSFRPISVLKGGSIKTSKGARVRNALVVTQFAISACLIISSLILSRQLQFIQNKDMGFQREHIVTFRLIDREILKKMEIFKTALLEIPGVHQVSSASNLPNYISSNTNIQWPGKPEEIEWFIYQGRADENYVDVYSLEIVRGRNFSQDDDVPGKAVMINESAAKALNWEDPIGMELVNWRDTARIVGIMKDFHQHSLHQSIMPLQLFYSNQERYVFVRIAGDDIQNTLKSIEEIKGSFSETYPFNYTFFDDEFNKAYKKEQKTGEAALWFTIITIIIACLGLYGLAAFTAEQRVKEVGIRKVLGAPSFHLALMLSKNFTYPVIISFVLAVPISYYVMSQWLNDFAYHVRINIFDFVITFIGVIVMAWITVGYRTFRVANSNPVESLKEE